MKTTDCTALRGALRGNEVEFGQSTEGASWARELKPKEPVGITFDPEYHNRQAGRPLIELPGDDDDDHFWRAIVAAAVNRWDDEGDEDL